MEYCTTYGVKEQRESNSQSGTHIIRSIEPLEIIWYSLTTAMDIQGILIFILAVLTVNLIAVGIYVILVLKDFRETIKKANSVLDNVHEVTNMVANPITSLAGVIAGVTQGVRAIKSISTLFDERE